MYDLKAEPIEFEYFIMMIFSKYCSIKPILLAAGLQVMIRKIQELSAEMLKF